MDLIIVIVFDEAPCYVIFSRPIISSLLGSNIHLSILFSTPPVCVFFF
jgi:hypothetical protein